MALRAFLDVYMDSPKSPSASKGATELAKSGPRQSLGLKRQEPLKKDVAAGSDELLLGPLSPAAPKL